MRVLAIAASLLTRGARWDAATQDADARTGFKIIGPRLRITAKHSTHVLHYDMSPTFLLQVMIRSSVSICMRLGVHPVICLGNGHASVSLQAFFALYSWFSLKTGVMHALLLRTNARTLRSKRERTRAWTRGT